MSSLNGLPVLVSGGCVFRSSDHFQTGGTMPLSFTAIDGSEPGIAVNGAGAGFSITISGFVPGTSMTSEAKGTLGDGRLVVIFTLVNRIAELSDGAVYRVDYMVAERRA